MCFYAPTPLQNRTRRARFTGRSGAGTAPSTEVLRLRLRQPGRTARDAQRAQRERRATGARGRVEAAREPRASRVRGPGWFGSPRGFSGE